MAFVSKKRSLHQSTNIQKKILIVFHIFLFYCKLHSFADTSNEGEWKFVSNLVFEKTQRGRQMLCYEGYRYVTNQNSTKNIFWRCTHYVKFGCRASVVTSRDLTMLRYAGTHHSHLPEKKEKWTPVQRLFKLYVNAEHLTKKRKRNIKNWNKMPKSICPTFKFDLLNAFFLVVFQLFSAISQV